MLTNAAAAHTCERISYLHQNNALFDHVPIEVRLNVAKFDDEIDTPVYPAPIAVDGESRTNADRRDDERRSKSQFLLKYGTIGSHCT